LSVERTGSQWLAISAADGSGERLLFEGDVVPIAWQSDSSRVFFGPSAGSLTSWDAPYRISSLRPDGTGLIAYPMNVRAAASGAGPGAYKHGEPQHSDECENSHELGTSIPHRARVDGSGGAHRSRH
jgi:hypothetical protein